MRQRRCRRLLPLAGGVGAVVLLTLSWAAPASGQSGVSVHGFVREHVSFNTQNPPETEQKDSWALSMARSTAYLEAKAQYNWGGLTLIGRGDYEPATSYLDRLGDAAKVDFRDYYSEADLREFYLDLYLGKRVTVRLGKQQVVWGRSDFFRGLDIVHGFNYSWRSFLEVENEQLRKPLILANLQIEIPPMKGKLQALVRPGLDRGRDIGNTYDLSGGRWANQPNKGFDFIPLVPYNYKHSEGDYKDVTFGFRWTGTAGPAEYTLNYLRTFNNDPVVNSAFVPYKSPPIGPVGEFIYPKVDLVGFTIDTDIKAIDLVARAEVSLTLDQPFNVGSEFFGGVLPGFGGITKKDTLRWMVAFDKQWRGAQKVLGASRPAFFNFQVFDTWLLDYDKQKDDIVDLAGYGAPKGTHSTFFTVILAWNYRNDRINPSLAAGVDNHGEGFVIPAVELVRGNHWRLKVEYDWFLPKHKKLPGQIENKTHLIGYFANNSQLAARLTFQF